MEKVTPKPGARKTENHLAFLPADILREYVRLEWENEALKETIFRSKSMTFPTRRES